MPALFDRLFSRAPAIVEADNPVGVHGHVGRNKSNPRKQFCWMPFDFGSNASGFLLQRGPAFEACEEPFALEPRRAANRSAQQVPNMLAQDVVGSQANGIDISCIFQCLIKFRIYISCIRPKERHNRPLCISHDHWLQERFPAFTAMHVFRSQSAGFKHPKLIEDKIGGIARTSKGTGPYAVLLGTMGWTD